MKRYKNKKLSIDIPEILSIKRTIIFREPVLNTTFEIKNNKNNKDNTNEKEIKKEKDKNDLKQTKNNLEIIIEKPDDDEKSVEKINITDDFTTKENKLKKQYTFINMSEEEDTLEDKNNSIVSKLGGIFSFVPKLFYKEENKNSTSDINELISNTLEPSNNSKSSKSDINSKINIIQNNHLEDEHLSTDTPTPTPLEHSEKHNEYENNYNFNIYEDSKELKSLKESKEISELK
jgi:hypothetical protein